ncbi:MAG: SRPBCC family protein [Coriobacteriales bacterium]
MRTRQSIRIERPCEEVFWFLADHTNERRWRAELLATRFVGEVRQGVGTHLRQTLSYQGRIVEADLEITDFVPGERIGFTVHGGVRAHGSISVRAERGGTRVVAAGSAELKGSAAMMERFITQAVERIVIEDLTRLKRVLEAA